MQSPMGSGGASAGGSRGRPTGREILSGRDNAPAGVTAGRATWSWWPKRNGVNDGGASSWLWSWASSW